MIFITNLNLPESQHFLPRSVLDIVHKPRDISFENYHISDYSKSSDSKQKRSMDRSS